MAGRLVITSRSSTLFLGACVARLLHCTNAGPCSFWSQAFTSLPQSPRDTLRTKPTGPPKPMSKLSATLTYFSTVGPYSQKACLYLYPNTRSCHFSPASTTLRSPIHSKAPTNLLTARQGSTFPDTILCRPTDATTPDLAFECEDFLGHAHWKRTRGGNGSTKGSQLIEERKRASTDRACMA